MKRSIPPKTMRDLNRARSPLQHRQGIEFSISVGAGVKAAKDQASREESAFSITRFNKPRNWKFQTKPVFRKIKDPLVDVFREAEEVLIVIDLGAFRREDISTRLTPGRCSIVARRGNQEFREEIDLPPEVDLDHCCTEILNNGVLEIVLPRKRKPETRTSNIERPTSNVESRPNDQ